jgi:hypothetical protein
LDGINFENYLGGLSTNHGEEYENANEGVHNDGAKKRKLDPEKSTHRRREYGTAVSSLPAK